MISLRTRPPPPLNQFIECLWYSSGYAPAHQLERILPTGRAGMAINLREDRIRVTDLPPGTTREFAGAVVSGPRSQPFILETSQQKSVAGVQFTACGASAILGLPVSECANRHLALEDLWGGEATVLREQLLEVESPHSALAVFEKSLLRRLAHLPAGYAVALDAVAQFSSSPNSARVREVSESTGYSAKRFIRLFQDNVGLTPKMFCRVQRFQRVLDRLVDGLQTPFACLAVDCGYFDQSHLIRDFRQFSGVTPCQYHPANAERKNHLALETPDSTYPDANFIQDSDSVRL